MSAHEREDRVHTREDYSSTEDYLAYCRLSGVEPFDHYGRPTAWIGGPDEEAARMRAIYGTGPSARKPRVTTGLSRSDFLSLYRSVALANLKGLTLDTFTTIAWSTFGYVDDAAVAVEHSHIMELYRHWCADNGIPCAAIWTKERGTKHGLHSHILSHVPGHMQLSYRSWMKAALERRTGQKVVRPRWDQTTPKVASLHVSDTKKERKGATSAQWEIFHYMTKGVLEAGLAKLLKTSHSVYLNADFRQARLKPQGKIAGRRIGQTRNLKTKAQEEFDLECGLPSIWPAGRRQSGELPFDDVYLERGLRLTERTKILSSLDTLDV